MKPESSDEIRNEVRIHYAAVARTETGCCTPGCCAPSDPAATTADADRNSRRSMSVSPAEVWAALIKRISAARRRVAKITLACCA